MHIEISSFFLRMYQAELEVKRRGVPGVDGDYGKVTLEKWDDKK